MSLFQAYSNTSKNDSKTSPQTSGTEADGANLWLNNSSYPASLLQPPVIDVSSVSSSDESVNILEVRNTRLPTPVVISIGSDTNDSDDEKSSKRAKKSKNRKRRKRDTSSVRSQRRGYKKKVENIYFEDTSRDKTNLTSLALGGTAKPSYILYKSTYRFKSSNESKKKQITPRYYAENIDSVRKKVNKDDNRIKRTVITNEENQKNETNDFSWGLDVEKEQVEKTKEFNEMLSEDPGDIKLWINYIKFQDVISQFQKDRGTKDVRRTITWQRQLAITNKALDANPNCTELLKLKLDLSSKLSPADQFSNEIESLLNKDPGNISLWQALIMASQASLAICTVPKVLTLYSRCLSNLQRRLRANAELYDEQILEMLYRCVTFLRQAGLWEQMWETLRLNLILNLNLNNNSFQFNNFIDEKKLIDMEEVIVTSRLPLNQLWLRVESLRESCHWVSIISDQLELVGDSRRFVLPEEVADFVQPLKSRDSSLKLAVYSILSLKVPLLPMRDCTAHYLKLADLEWDADSIEMLLPLAYPATGILSGSKEKQNVMKKILEGNLTSGPQYLKLYPAQEPYLDFIRDVFRAIAESFSSTEPKRTIIFLWWLRFERMLVLFKEKGKEDNKQKKLKSMVKDFLKNDANRNNLYFYKEYALIEKEIGNFDSCIKILETAIGMQNDVLSTIPNSYEKNSLCSIFRALFETLLEHEIPSEDRRSRILKVATRMVSGPDEDRLERTETFLVTSLENFLEQPISDSVATEYFLPNFECDLITCYVYFLYAKNSDISEGINVLEKCLEHSERNKYLHECFYESTIAILHLNCKQAKLQEALKQKVDEALNLYPMNCYFLTVNMEIESELPCWKLSRNPCGKFQLLALCLAIQIRIQRLENLELQDAADAAANKLLSIHRRLARDPESQRCPLLWRLYMLFLRQRNLCEGRDEKVYHESVAQCPWTRGIYTDAAQLAPQLLTEIQDLIREKELRMHVTPEELDILRG